MNIKRKEKGRPVHKMRDGFRESICGLIWRDGNNAKETTKEVTCKHCLRMLEGK